MHFKIILIATLLLITPAQARNERWRTDFGKGTFVAAVYNAGNASFEVSCPVGHGKPAGIYFRSPAYQRVEGETRSVTIIADNQTVHIEMTDGYFEASNLENAQLVLDVLDLLANAKSAAFAVETAGNKMLEEFSLASAAEELADDGRHGVRDCFTTFYHE